MSALICLRVWGVGAWRGLAVSACEPEPTGLGGFILAAAVERTLSPDPDKVTCPSCRAEIPAIHRAIAEARSK